MKRETEADNEMALGNKEPLLQVKSLCAYFPIYNEGFVRKQIDVARAVEDVSFDVFKGETLGIVGESGSGKTTCVRSIIRALKPTSGKVIFESKTLGKVDLALLEERQMKQVWREIQMVFQDPFSSLNPRMTVGEIIAEPMVIHKLAAGEALERKVLSVMEKVGLSPGHRERYPHAFSGGQRQRIGIARALIMNPSLVIADEAVSALDVSVQAQIINLLQDLQEELDLTYLFVAHDLSVVRHICDRVAVMYQGKIVEIGETESLFAQPKHAYTQSLLASIPSPDPDRRMEYLESS